MRNVNQDHLVQSNSKTGERHWYGREIRHNKADLNKVNKLLTYAIMLDSHIVVYILFMIMLIELKEVLSQELECFSSKTTTVMEYLCPRFTDYHTPLHPKHLQQPYWLIPYY